MKNKNGKKEKYEILRARDYKKSNELINARGKSTPLAQKLFAIGLQNKRIDETNHVVMEMSGTELQKIFNNKSHNFYPQIEKLCDRTVAKEHATLFDWNLLIKNKEDKKLEAHQVVTDASFKNNTLVIRYNEFLTPQIMRAEKNYTLLALNEMLCLKSGHSITLYETLKSAYDRAKWENGNKDDIYAFRFRRTELKFRLGIVESHGNRIIKNELEKDNPDYALIENILDENGWNKYTVPGNFNRDVIKKSVNELNSKTSLSIETEPWTMDGKNDIGTTFYVSMKDKKDDKNENVKSYSKEEKDQILNEVAELLMPSYKLSQIIEICEYANFDKRKILKAFEIVGNYKGDVNEPMALIKAAIRDDYNESAPIKGKNSFNNFKQTYNNIDFEELENQLLDN
ncbi:replication initiation protein [Butyrivibrio hungatei]|uniref:Replication initiation protein RepB n=1 Tax=Butyrivibrio hungatei TaxID=185008 RepID=A0A1D9P5P8_9FIRM|nr:replication initiation protein [Butyrivibrio hungatei]AOZ97946.1 replication initiation protein RepB [Butyrivibrio hungatei]